MATGIMTNPLQEEPVPIQEIPQPAAAAAAQPAATIPATYEPVQVAAPTPWVVDDKQTMAGQVKSLIDEGSPLVEQARTNAKQAANERGIMNSALAVSAGETAALNAVQPIAQNDASTYAKAAGYTVDQQNQANVRNAEFGNVAAQFNANAINDVGLQQINNENQKLLQTNTSAASLMNQATGVINNIMMSTTMDQAAKTEASRQIYENLRTQLSIISATSGLDLASLLAENPYPEPP